MKKKSVLCLAVVAALAAGALWYTRPVSIARAVRAQQATLVDACLMLAEPVQEGGDTYDALVLYAEPGNPAMDAVLAVMEANTCRAHLSNLFPLPHGDTSIYRSGENNLNLTLAIDGIGYDLITSDLRDDLNVLRSDTGFFTTNHFSVEKEFYEELSAVVREYGVPREK